MNFRWMNRDLETAERTLRSAFYYLGMRYASTASFGARGYYLPEQCEALKILENALEGLNK